MRPAPGVPNIGVVSVVWIDVTDRVFGTVSSQSGNRLNPILFVVLVDQLERQAVGLRSMVIEFRPCSATRQVIFITRKRSA